LLDCHLREGQGGVKLVHTTLHGIISITHVVVLNLLQRTKIIVIGFL
jgi:hypothetical protein